MLSGILAMLQPSVVSAAAATGTDSADPAGRRAFRDGRFQDAARHFRDALDNHPSADEKALRLLYNLGRSHQELAKGGDTGHNCEAAKWFEQQIRLAERLGLDDARRVEKARSALVVSKGRCQRSQATGRPPGADDDGDDVHGALVVSVSEGALMLDSGARRTAVLPEVAIRLGSSTIQAELGGAMAAENPNAGILRPGLIGLAGPVGVGVSAPIVLRPVRTVGVRLELGLRVPLAQGVLLELGALGTMWPLAENVISAEGRLGVASEF